ncbi:hypothetical protein AB0N09_43470, partial [Streptomyces erythrochromogenes]|uniref:hypothetical protein n=1 Tax=Streptomyces erythrochromogenes TaxID=285574 RepID=UPI003418300C
GGTKGHSTAATPATSPDSNSASPRNRMGNRVAALGQASHLPVYFERPPHDPLQPAPVTVTTQDQLDTALNTPGLTLILLEGPGLNVGSPPRNPACRVVAKTHASVTGKGILYADDFDISASGTAEVHVGGTARVTAVDDARVIATGGDIWAYNRARVKINAVTYGCVYAHDSARVTARGVTSVTAQDDVQVTAYDSTCVTAEGRARVTSHHDAFVTASDNVEVNANGTGTINTFDNVRVNAIGPGTVHADGESTVIANSGTVHVYSPDVSLTNHGATIIREH